MDKKSKNISKENDQKFDPRFAHSVMQYDLEVPILLDIVIDN